MLREVKITVLPTNLTVQFNGVKVYKLSNKSLTIIIIAQLEQTG